MSRSLMTFICAYIITRLIYRLSGFNPIRAIPGILGYLTDLGIWALAWILIWRLLKVLKIGRKKQER